MLKPVLIVLHRKHSSPGASDRADDARLYARHPPTRSTIRGRRRWTAAGAVILFLFLGIFFCSLISLLFLLFFSFFLSFVFQLFFFFLFCFCFYYCSFSFFLFFLSEVRKAPTHPDLSNARSIGSVCRCATKKNRNTRYLSRGADAGDGSRCARPIRIPEGHGDEMRLLPIRPYDAGRRL